MKLYDVIILTDKRYVNPPEINNYIANVLLEDKLVQDALEKQGLKTLKLSWDDPQFDWDSTHYVLFRTTWDYFNRIDEFSNWLNHISNKTQMINPETIIRWNIDKRYLIDLIANGIHCATTVFIEKGDNRTLSDIYNTYGFNEMVVKPVFSASARHTYKIDRNNLPAHESIFKELIANEPMLIQPFQYKIVTEGEKSLILIDGKYSHAVLKVAKQGDFRVQDDFGGSVSAYKPTKEEIAFAEKVVSICNPKVIYARVDLFTDNTDKIALAELELIEPELWFRTNVKAAEKLALAVKKLF